ncbi:cytochrome P450 2C38-like, partial [Python bivittatus]|uniref:Cytochrome P450 2C38-like n=1 Tax=Python bivittatus TaxID=176946 RepID=A0A9F5N233_PYTBI
DGYDRTTAILIKTGKHGHSQGLGIYKKKGQLPPGPTPWPFLGNLLQRDVLPVDTSYKKLTAKYGPIFTVWIGSKPMVALCGYEVVKDALLDHAEEFGGRTETPVNRRLFQNKDGATSYDNQWRELRRFTLSALRDFGMGKKRMSERVQEEALCLAEEMATTKGQAFDPRRRLTSAVSNVIYQIFIENQQIMESQARFFNSFVGLEQNSSEVIYTSEGLVITVFGLFIAGTISTSHSLLYSLLVMAKLPHIQAKVQQEIDEVVGEHRTPSMEDRLKMPFTNAVVHEVQRYQKGSLETFPRATTCDTKFHGYNIPKYVAVAPILSSVHFDPLYWETPEKFNPDHFFVFFFAIAGKRACPGEALARMELFLFFSTLLQKFTFHLVGDSKDTDVMSLYVDFTNKNQYPLIRAVKRSVHTCVQ